MQGGNATNDLSSVLNGNVIGYEIKFHCRVEEILATNDLDLVRHTTNDISVLLTVTESQLFSESPGLEGG